MRLSCEDPMLLLCFYAFCKGGGGGSAGLAPAMVWAGLGSDLFTTVWSWGMKMGTGFPC